MKRKILTKWLVSYLIILLIPLATICINYIYSVKIIGEQITRSNELIVDNLGRGIDEYLKEAYQLHSYLYYEDSLKSVCSNNEKNEQFYFDAKELRTQLNSHANYDSKISCMIYLPKLGYMFDLKTGNDIETYYYTYRMHAPEISEYEEWIQVLDGTYRGDFFVGEFLHASTGEPCIVYANSIRQLQPVNIFISIPVSEISELTEKVSEGSNFMMLVDDEIQMVWNSEGASNVNNGLRKTYQNAKKGENGEDYYLIEQSSGFEQKVSYCMMISKKAYEQKQRYVSDIFCIGLIVSLLVAFKVLNTLLKQRHEKNSLNERLKTQEELMQSNYLLMLMKGRKPERYRDAVQISDEQSIVLVGIQIPEFETKQNEKDELLLFTVDNIFSELMKEEKCYKIEDGEYLFYLFLVEEENEHWRTECMKKAEYLNQILSAWCKEGMFIAISKTEKGLKQICVQYNDIMEEFADRKVLGVTKVTDLEKKHRNLSSKQRMVGYIQEIIEKHFDDCNLNVMWIAEKVGKTAKYISEVFKEETGESLLFAINRKRIEKAQALMRSGQYKLTDIPELTGYSNMNTFRRNFQQITGISPSQFVENKEKKE